MLEGFRDLSALVNMPPVRPLFPLCVGFALGPCFKAAFACLRFRRVLIFLLILAFQSGGSKRTASEIETPLAMFLSGKTIAESSASG